MFSDIDVVYPNNECEIKKELLKLIETNKKLNEKLDRVEASNNVLVHEFSKLSANVKSLVVAFTGQKMSDMEALFPIQDTEYLEKIIRLSQSSDDFPLKLVNLLFIVL